MTSTVRPSARSSRPTSPATSRSSSTTRMRACAEPARLMPSPDAAPSVRSAALFAIHQSLFWGDCVRLVSQKQEVYRLYRPSGRPNKGEIPAEGGNMTASVLIADDDPSISRALSFLMQKEGHDVRTVADGEQALAAIERRRPDIVLLDLMMPKGNGYEVCRTLRANRR